MEWTFPRVPKMTVQSRDLAADNFATEKRTPLSVLMREATQNPADARVPGSNGPVRVTFRLLEGKELDSAYLRSLVTDTFISHLNAASPPTQRFELPPEPRALVIEDFGTTGLEGTFTDPDIEGPKQNWNAFWFREGEGAKSSKASNGRAGQGKVTLYRASAVRAVFGLTTRASDGLRLMMGRSSFVRNYDAPGGGRCDRYSFWHQGDSQVAKPSQNAADIQAFEKAFRLERGPQPGLSLVIPYPDGFDPAKAIAHLIGDFYVPIARGRLEMAVNGIELNESTLASAADQYLDDEEASRIFSPFKRDYRAFVSRVITAGPPSTRLKTGWWSRSKLTDADFENGEAETLKTAIAGGELVAVRCPIRVRESGCEPVDSHFDVYLEMPQDLATTEEAYIRGDLLIGDEHPMGSSSYLPPARGMTLVTDRPVSALLADAEEPTHLKWNGSRPRLAEEYDRPREVLTAVRQAMPRLLALLSNAVNKRDSKALSRFFPKSDSGGTSEKKGNNRQDRDKGSDETDKNPPPAPPRPFRWQHGTSWDSVVCSAINGAPPETLPLACKVEFAYEGLDADAFGSYDPFDFDLSDTKQFKIAVEGGTIQHRALNAIQFTVDTLPFSLKVDGFDTHIRRRMRIDYSLNQDGTDIVNE